MRSGRYVKQAGDYKAFIPAPLPPNPPLIIDTELISLLSNADRALGRLDGATSILPNPGLFVAMYVRQEAVLSAQIEGTQSTLEEVLQFEIDVKSQDYPRQVKEILNYVNAIYYGIKQLEDFPLGLQLLKDLHSKLLEGVRGSDRTPGEFRKVQNWIGPPGCNIATASFVPPPTTEMHSSLQDLEKFLRDTTSFPILLQCGLVHAQFETIHPFVDGNGRIGRLLIILLLCQRGILQGPLLYLSHYLKRHQSEYYARLTSIRTDGDWEGWLKFFLRGICDVSQAATTTARSILNLREEHRQLIGQKLGSSAYGLRLLDLLFEHPIVNVTFVAKHLECAYITASKTVNQLVKLNLLKEITGWQRNRLYRYEPYLNLFSSPEESKSFSLLEDSAEENNESQLSEDSKI